MSHVVIVSSYGGLHTMIVEKEICGLGTGRTVVILRVEGLIKLGESAEFFVAALESLFQDPIIDLAKVDYIDSTGVGEFIGRCVAIARAGHKLVLMNVSERIVRLIKIAQATELLRVLTAEEAADYYASPEESHSGVDDLPNAPHTRVVTIRDTRADLGSAAPTKQMRVVTFHGDLQQKEYRFFPWRIARKLGLNGWVRNMADGTVMACVEGETSAIQEWLSDVTDGPFGYLVTRIEQELMDFTGEFYDFEVRP
jgi:anti-anti-sigma factor